MGHSIIWDNADKTVILQHYIPPASKDDLLQLAAESAEMLKTVPHTVHLILDERNIRLMLTTTDLQYLEILVPPNQGSVVVVVPEKDFAYKQLTQNLGTIIAPNATRRTHFASSIEQAREILRRDAEVRYA